MTWKTLREECEVWESWEIWEENHSHTAAVVKGAVFFPFLL